MSLSKQIANNYALTGEILRLRMALLTIEQFSKNPFLTHTAKAALTSNIEKLIELGYYKNQGYGHHKNDNETTQNPKDNIPRSNKLDQ